MSDPVDESIKILYIEDHPDTLHDWRDYMCKQGWKCEGVRSLEAAKGLLDGDYRPSFAIHDCRPLSREKDQADNEKAGDELYALLVEKEIPVVVISGTDESTKLETEPYVSDPPLTWISKPVTAEKINEAVEAYKRWELRQH
jgi:hypothetical protein